jgi:beta-N-acetylhexosaminidase
MHNYSILLFLAGILLATSCQPTSPTESASEDPTPEITDAMLGQLIMQGFRGLEIDSISPVVKDQLVKGEIGNIILFDYDVGLKRYGRNIASPAQVEQLLADLQALAPGFLLTAIDQEGGRVTRLRPDYGFPELAAAQDMGAREATDSTTYYATQNAASLKNVGFNVNFAPVVDLNVNPENPVIGKIKRSFGATTDQVVRHARAWIAPHADAGILSVLKHFPGHGSSQSDSHKGFTDVTTTWTPEELAPFEQLLATEEALAVMTAHVFNRSIDSIYPATLSPHYIQGMLRDSFHYDGVVFSDDLQMNAVNKLFDFETIIKQSILAGVDMLVFGNNLEDYDETLARRTIATLRKLLDNGEVPAERILQSYERITNLKAQLSK